MLPRSHTYYPRIFSALSSLPPTSGLRSRLSCTASHLQTTNKSRRLRFDLEVYLTHSNLQIPFRLLLGPLNEETTTLSNYPLSFRRMITFSKIWSLLVGSRPRLWNYLICPRVISARKQGLWQIILNGGLRRSALLPHSRQARCHFQLTR